MWAHTKNDIGKDKSSVGKTLSGNVNLDVDRKETWEFLWLNSSLGPFEAEQKRGGRGDRNGGGLWGSSPTNGQA